MIEYIPRPLVIQVYVVSLGLKNGLTTSSATTAANEFKPDDTVLIVGNKIFRGIDKNIKDLICFTQRAIIVTL